MKKINKPSKLLINFTESQYRIILLLKTEYESLCKVFTKQSDETKNKSFL